MSHSKKDAAAAALPKDRFDCLTCGRGVAADEDGCCATCGRAVVMIQNGTPLYGRPGCCDLCGTPEAAEKLRTLNDYTICTGCEPLTPPPVADEKAGSERAGGGE